MEKNVLAWRAIFKKIYSIHIVKLAGFCLYPRGVVESISSAHGEYIDETDLRSAKFNPPEIST